MSLEIRRDIPLSRSHYEFELWRFTIFEHSKSKLAILRPVQVRKSGFYYAGLCCVGPNDQTQTATLPFEPFKF